MIYQAEDDLVSRREASEDVRLFKATCQKISQIMHDIQQLKGKTNAENDVVNKRIECSLHFLTLRKLNRLAHLRCKKVRETTNESKQRTDQYHLQLSNLAYEVSHQEKEITKCLEFKSRDEDIKLVNEKDFYKDAPPEISKPETTKSDAHQKTICRLNWELEQRIRLAEKLDETNSLKEVVLTDIETKRKHLEQLQPKLADVLEATKPVQAYLNMPFDQVKEQQRIARYLPAPLYVLYTQATGYRDACDKKIKIVIEGDTEEAARQHEISGQQQDEASDDEEDEDERQEGASKKRKKHRRHQSQAEQMATKKRELLKSHPLTVKLTLTCKDNLSLVLVFSYLLKLRIVTVRPSLHGLPSDTQHDLLQAGVLLQCLYDQDDGRQTPNPANRYQLQKLGLNFRRDCQELTGTPYHWVQWLSGLQFMSGGAPVGAPGAGAPRMGSDLSAPYMEEVMKKLRRRVGDRLALQQQISAITKGVVCVPEEFQNKFPVKINSKIRSWDRVAYDDYKSMKHCELLINDDLVHETDIIYSITVEHGSARLIAHVAISPDYPSQRPLFALRLQWHDTRTRDNDENIRLMEAELNLHEDLKRKPHPYLLTTQIQRLLMCTDVYLESSCASQAATPIEFPREKIMPRMTRGPQRAMPFKFLDNVSIFTQR